MHPTAVEKSGFTTTLNVALSPASPERSVELYHRKQLARFGKWLYRLGFVPGTAGNLSVRLGPDRILATPTAMSKCLLKASDMVVVDMEGRRVGESRNVTSEIGMDLAIYRQLGTRWSIMLDLPISANARSQTRSTSSGAATVRPVSG